MAVDLHHHSHRHILFYGIHEPATTMLLTRCARGGWTFIDVGANAGYYSLLAADLGGPSSRIVAFEPNPAPAAMLRESLTLNAISNVSVEEAACSDESASTVLRLSPDGNTGLSTLEPSVAAAWGRDTGLPVPSVRLDDYCAERGINPDVVKIDVEGHELSTVRGMQSLLEVGRPSLIICELSSDLRRPGSVSVLEYLGGFGYRAHRILNEGQVRPLLEGDELSGDHENVLFVSPTLDDDGPTLDDALSTGDEGL